MRLLVALVTLAALGCTQKNPYVGTYEAKIEVDPAIARAAGFKGDELKALEQVNPENLRLTLRHDGTYQQGTAAQHMVGQWRIQEEWLHLTPKQLIVDGKQLDVPYGDPMMAAVRMKVEQGKLTLGATGMKTVFAKVSEP